MPKPAPRPVLLVEDDPYDARRLGDALEGGRGLLTLQLARDGEEALAWLRGKPRAQLVLLDWRLPGKSGAEVLREIRADAALRLIPVIVLTSSTSEEDLRAAYSLGANSFLRKPGGPEQLRIFADRLENFWLLHAHLAN